MNSVRHAPVTVLFKFQFTLDALFVLMRPVIDTLAL